MMKTMRALAVLLATALLLTPMGCTDQVTEEDVAPQDGLDVGAEAPDFRLKNQDQETVVLSEAQGESNVILVFYPLAFTPV